jgi:hypothetical protein
MRYTSSAMKGILFIKTLEKKVKFTLNVYSSMSSCTYYLCGMNTEQIIKELYQDLK